MKNVFCHPTVPNCLYFVREWKNSAWPNVINGRDLLYSTHDGYTSPYVIWSFFVYVPVEVLLCCTLVGACGPKAMNKILFEDRATVSYRQTSNIRRTLVGNKIGLIITGTRNAKSLPCWQALMHCALSETLFRHNVKTFGREWNQFF